MNKPEDPHITRIRVTSWKLFLQRDQPEKDHRALDKFLKEWQTVLDKYRQCRQLENTKQLNQEDAAIGNFCASLLKKEHTFTPSPSSTESAHNQAPRNPKDEGGAKTTPPEHSGEAVKASDMPRRPGELTRLYALRRGLTGIAASAPGRWPAAP